MAWLTKAAAAAVSVAVVALVAPGTAAAAPAPDAEKRALLIGISAYQSPTVSTPGSANDARDMRDLLVSAGWPESNIRTLVDGDATVDAIRSGIDWLVDSSKDNTFSVVHYSGHTKQLQSGYDDGDAEDWDEYLWSVDNEFVSDGEFGERMRALRGHAWINISNCEAAGFDDGVSSPNRLVTAASQEDQKGYERTDTRRSIFSGLMTGAFRSNRDADRNGAVSIQEAFAHAAEMAPKQSASGEFGPQNPYTAGGDNTQWYLKAPASRAAGSAPSLIPPGLLPPELVKLLAPILPPGILAPVEE
jgi:hypothetical protein